MPKLIPFCGLPRSGSTLLCNVIGQHPDVTLSADSALPDLLITILDQAQKAIHESQYDADLTYKLYEDFIDFGIKSWSNNLCQTKFYLDKSRAWSEIFNLVFSLYPETKLIFTIRDLRGIYLSFDKLSSRGIFSNELSNHYDQLDTYDDDFLSERVDYFLTGDMVKKHLTRLKEVVDLDRDYSKNIKIVKYEDFMQSPNKILYEICNFLNLEKFNFNLNNIEQVNYKDTFYLPYGYHKIKKSLTPSIPNYDDKMRKSAQNKIFKDYRWYYSLFYPEVLR
jgi:sulfotransferase